jgi:hypothetical protein
MKIDIQKSYCYNFPNLVFWFFIHPHQEPFLNENIPSSLTTLQMKLMRNEINLFLTRNK